MYHHVFFRQNRRLKPAKLTILEGFWEMQLGMKALRVPWGIWWSILTLLIDFGQPFRVLSSGAYGWKSEVAFYTRHFDICFLIVRYIVNLFAGRFFYFILAGGTCLSIVCLAFVNSAVLLRSGKVSLGMERGRVIFPSTGLRLQTFLHSYLVKWFLVANLMWILEPIDCRGWNWKNSFASLILDNRSQCDPWGMPLVWMAIPAILLALALIVFSYLMTSYTLAPDPLCGSPGDVSTLRVQYMWLSVKIALTLGSYVAPRSPALLMLPILVLMTVTVVMHYRKLPHLSPVINKVQMGLLTTLLWICFATVFTYIGTRNSRRQTAEEFQIVMISAAPVAFIVGYLLVEFRYRFLREQLEVLQEHYQLHKEQIDNERISGQSGSNPCAFESQVPCSTAFAELDVEGYLSIATLHLQQPERDMNFLCYMMMEARRYQMNMVRVIVFEISMLRYYCKSVVGIPNKIVELQSLGRQVKFDHRYHLYCMGIHLQSLEGRFNSAVHESPRAKELRLKLNIKNSSPLSSRTTSGSVTPSAMKRHGKIQNTPVDKNDSFRTRHFQESSMAIGVRADLGHYVGPGIPSSGTPASPVGSGVLRRFPEGGRTFSDGRSPSAASNGDFRSILAEASFSSLSLEDEMMEGWRSIEDDVRDREPIILSADPNPQA